MAMCISQPPFMRVTMSGRNWLSVERERDRGKGRDVALRARRRFRRSSIPVATLTRDMLPSGFLLGPWRRFRDISGFFF